MGFTYQEGGFKIQLSRGEGLGSSYQEGRVSVAGGFKVVFTSNNNLNVLLGGNYEILEGPLSHVPWQGSKIYVRD